MNGPASARWPAGRKGSRPRHGRHAWERILSGSILLAVAGHATVFLLNPDFRVAWSGRPADARFQMLVAPAALSLRPERANAADAPAAGAPAAREPAATLETVERPVIPPAPDLALDPAWLEAAIPAWPRFESRFVAEIPPPPLREAVDERDGYEMMSARVRAPALRNRQAVVRFLERRYRPIVRATGLEGTVRLLLWIDEAGNAQKVSVDGSSGHRELDDISLELTNVLRFRAAHRDGKPIRVIIGMPVHFQSGGAGLSGTR